MSDEPYNGGFHLTAMGVKFRICIWDHLLTLSQKVMRWLSKNFELQGVVVFQG